MNVPEIVQKIEELFDILKHTNVSSTELARKINSILIFGDGVPSDLLSAAWTQFARQRGVKNE
jgi:hypothetical protein